MSLISFYEDHKVIACFSEEARTVTGLFAGFSFIILVANANSVSAEIGFLRGLSLLVSGLSTILLIFSTYFMAGVTAISKAKKVESEFSDALDELDLDVLKTLIVIIAITGIVFMLNIMMLSFLTHYLLGIGIILGVIIIGLCVTFTEEILKRFNLN